MDKITSELSKPNLAKIIESSVPHSFSYEGYEQLHEEAMDKISVSIYSDFEEAFDGVSQNDLKDLFENQEKKMKISLSQEQLKLKTGDTKNFLSVPISSRKSRSASFSINLTQPRAVKIPEVPIDLMVPEIKAYDENDDEVVYAVPSRALRTENLIRTSSASLTPSDVISQISSTGDVNRTGFKYSFSFYCKVCNNILNDPRTLDCLHTFCIQCLSKLDASNDLQNNQFWRKISGNSESSFQLPSLLSNPRSSVDSDNPLRAKFSLTGSSKGKKLFKDKSPTRSVKGRQSSIISFSEKPKSIICPTCGHTTEMTIHGVYRLPQNNLIARKIRETTGNNYEAFDSCQLCTFDVTATSACLTCNFNLCSNCKDIHKRHTSKHEFKNLEKKPKKSQSKDIGVRCLIHFNHDLKFFCTTCCQVICAECTILIHRGHKMTSISKAAKIYIETLKEAKDNTKPLSTYAIHSISKLNDISKKINKKCDEVEQDVETFLSDYFEALEVHKKTLMNQIARCRETKMDMIHCQQLDLERRSNEAKTAITFTETLLKEGTEAESLLFMNLLLRKFDNCRSSDRAMDVKIRDSLQFLPEVKAPSNQAQNNIPLFGIITTQIAIARNCSLESQSGLMNLRVNKKAEVVLQTRDIEKRPMCHGSAEVEVTVSYRDVAFKTLPTQVTDKRDGTYNICFIPNSPGFMQISIIVNSKAIQDSPFTVRARNLRPHSGIFHCCSFCSSNGKKVCACGGQMPGGSKGCGHGWDGWAGRRHWSCCASTLENSECSVANAIQNLAD